MEGTATVKNERYGEERHGGGSGCRRGRQRLRMRDVAWRDIEVAEVVEMNEKDRTSRRKRIRASTPYRE